MTKEKIVYVCQSCGAEFPRWMGKCSYCEQWNTIVEEKISVSIGLNKRNYDIDVKESKPLPITDIEEEHFERIKTSINEFDRILGGGIVKGSVILIGGEPGIGKSTLLHQVLFNMASVNFKCLYVTGEESGTQVRMRGDRLSALDKNLFIITETNVDVIIKAMKELQPDIVVIDSIQTVYKQEIPSSPGSVSQVRENAYYLSYLAKNMGTSIFFVGHITKDGTVAGPKVLEHIVDTVLYFEGEAHHSFRILRAVKNRFGSTNEIGIFEMTGMGLKEVQNPSQVLLQERSEDSSGTIVVPSIEGSRPLLIEVQSLTSYNGGFGAARRTTSGVDHRRVGLLIAVLEKKLGLNLYDQDVYVNIAGGLSIDEPAIDLGIVLSVVSSFRNRPINIGLVAAGEIGLTGEVRAVTQMEKRISEASRLGFKKAIISKNNISDGLDRFNIEILPVKNIQEAVEIIM